MKKSRRYIVFKVIMLFFILSGCDNKSWIMTNSESPQILLFETCPNPNISEETEARELYRFFRKKNIPYHIVTNDNRWPKPLDLSKEIIEDKVEVLNPKIIHIAIHGGATKLEISRNDSLTLQDIENMDIWENRIIVSGACESGQYAQLFLEKGAKMVIASTEEIRWRNLGKFFTIFYAEYFRKQEPDLALEEAINLFPEYRSYQIYK